MARATTLGTFMGGRPYRWADGSLVDITPLQQQRLAAGLTRTALAELAGVSVVTVRNAEKRVKRTSDTTLRKLAAALGVDVDAITSRGAP